MKGNAMTSWITTAEWLYEPRDEAYEYGSSKQYGSHIERTPYYDPFYGVYGDFIPGMDE
jgi:hypothetical protein